MAIPNRLNSNAKNGKVTIRIFGACDPDSNALNPKRAVTNAAMKCALRHIEVWYSFAKDLCSASKARKSSSSIPTRSVIISLSLPFHLTDTRSTDEVRHSFFILVSGTTLRLYSIYHFLNFFLFPFPGNELGILFFTRTSSAYSVPYGIIHGCTPFRFSFVVDIAYVRAIRMRRRSSRVRSPQLLTVLLVWRVWVPGQ